MTIQTPDWVKNAVFYQIFPDRFARGQAMVHPPGIRFKPWGSPPTEQGFQGGDLYGIAEKLDYLADLGITALYLNPIFAAAANHRYHTYDYLVVDPLLGGNAALRQLLDRAHGRGIRVVLDGVFNHAGRGFWAFHHILENGGDSPYLDWFIVRDWPLNPYPSDATIPLNYEAWWGLPALPKFNIANPGVRDYLLHVARHWIEFGIDGWRLDVPTEIDDPPFWRDFRTVVKSANPDAYIVGEIWDEGVEWLQGDRFDAAMNYVFNRAALGFFGAATLRTEYKPGGYALQKLTAAEFGAAVDAMVQQYDWEIVQAQLNLMDSHDTARTLWTVNGDESALRLAVFFQMTMPGAPCLYYGDEIGLTGSDDPECRGAFPWGEREMWNESLLAFHRRAIKLRQDLPALRTGRFQTLYADDGFFAFQRLLDDQEVVVVFNVAADERPLQLPLPNAGSGETHYVDRWNLGTEIGLSGHLIQVVVPGRDAAVLVRKHGDRPIG